VHRAHEAFAAPVDEQCALTTQRLGGERGGVLAHIDGGRMKLDEFSVGDHGAGASGDGDTLAARLAWIGGDGVDLAGAAGGEHHRARRQQQPAARLTTVDRRKLDALDAAITQQEIAGREAFDHADRGRRPHRGQQCRHDGAPGRVALDVQDAVPAMRRLAAQHEMAFQVLVERHAVAKQILDPVAGLARQQLGDFLVDDTGAGADRILGMMLGAVAFGQRRGDARLGP
jgi:hypothetical protein